MYILIVTVVLAIGLLIRRVYQRHQHEKAVTQWSKSFIRHVNELMKDNRHTQDAIPTERVLPVNKRKKRCDCPECQQDIRCSQ